jgi:hypothetical protein
MTPLRSLPVRETLDGGLRLPTQTPDLRDRGIDGGEEVRVGIDARADEPRGRLTAPGTNAGFDQCLKRVELPIANAAGDHLGPRPSDVGRAPAGGDEPPIRRTRVLESRVKRIKDAGADLCWPVGRFVI